MYIHVCIIYIYIYIERERERSYYNILHAIILYNLPPHKTPPLIRTPPPSKLIVPPSKLIVTRFASEGGVLMRGVIVPPSKLIVTICVPSKCGFLIRGGFLLRGGLIVYEMQ